VKHPGVLQAVLLRGWAMDLQLPKTCCQKAPARVYLTPFGGLLGSLQALCLMVDTTQRCKHWHTCTVCCAETCRPPVLPFGG
jgi:hypothetical protein